MLKIPEKSDLNFRSPPLKHNSNGDVRSVGIELEFAAQSAYEIASLICRLFKGNLEEVDPHRLKVTDSSLGNFTVELDSQYVHLSSENDTTPDSFFEELLPKHIQENLLELIGDMVKIVVPYELVSPPIPIDKLAKIDKLIEGLRALDVKGTDEGFFYAFGMHLNPEVYNFDAKSLLNVLRAFILLSDFLHETLSIDLTRRITPYIDPFPQDYIFKILDRKYNPDLKCFISDYVEFNPTRNQELDLFPLFCYLDKDLMNELVKDNLTKPRPTFHFRLPDCRLNDRDWSVCWNWNLWVMVEELAYNNSLLEEISLAYIEFIHNGSEEWSNRITHWIR